MIGSQELQLFSIHNLSVCSGNSSIPGYIISEIHGISIYTRRKGKVGGEKWPVIS
jgi:hypothetical protein